MDAILANLYEQSGIRVREVITTTSSNNGPKVTELYMTPMNPKVKITCPYVKKVILSENSPLRAAGVDGFILRVKKDARKAMIIRGTDGKWIINTNIISEARNVIKAIKQSNFKFR